MPRLVSRYKCQIARTIVVTGLLLTVADAAVAQDRIYWDGGNTVQNGTVDGGDGTWDEVSTNWTNQTGTANYAAYGLGALPDRRFTGTGGTVNVTAAAAQAGRMQFSSSGYRLEGAAVDVQGRLVLSTGTTTTIANAVTADGLESASSGALIIEATGTLQIDMGESVAAIAGNITNNGSLVFNRSDDLTLSNPISGSGLIRHQGTGILTLDGTGATYSGNVEVTNGTLRPFQVEILGVVTLDGGTLSELQPADPPAEIALGAGGGTIDVPFVTFGTGNNISGIGKLTKTGVGELRLKGDRTFSGGMDINQGRVVFRDSSGAVTTPFGSGPITVAAGARLDLADRMSVPNAVSLAETSVLRIATAFPTTLSGNINFGGGSEAITLLGGTNANQTVNFSGILSNGGFVASATAISTARTLEFSGAAANTYTGLTRIKTVAGAGLRFRLNKSANVTAVPGDLTVDAGTQVIVAASGQIADTATVQLNEGAAMTLGEATSVTETVGVLNGAGSIELASTSTLIITSGSFSGAISGDGSLTKQGAGTLVLSGDSTYTGTTTVAGGQLQVSGSLDGDVAVSSGATLSGAGGVGALTVAGGAIVAPGASAGTLSTGDMTLSDTSVLNVELAAPGTTGGGVNDLIQATGDLVLDGVLNVSDLGDMAAGTYTLITYTGELTDNGLAFGTTPAGFVYRIDTTEANAIRLIVSDPRTLLGLSATTLEFGSRRLGAAASMQVLTLESTGDTPVVFGVVELSGDHAADFTLSDACGGTTLAVGDECTVTVTQQSNTVGLRTATLTIASDAEDSPHEVALQVRTVGQPTLAGLDGGTNTYYIGASASRLDPDGATVLDVPGALALDGATLQVEMTTGANPAEDVLSFANGGGVSLSGTTAGSDVLIDSIVVGTLQNSIGAGNVLGVTFNADATVTRVQTLMRATTYRNINTSDPLVGAREVEITLSYLGQQVIATVSIDVQEPPFVPPPPELPVQPVVLTGMITADVTGEPGRPITIRDATITTGVTLTYVITGPGVTFETGVILGVSVIFEAPGLIQELQKMLPFAADGAIVEQLENGQIRITSDAYRALLLPVQTVVAADEEASEVYYGNNGEVALITDNGFGILVYALHINNEGLSSMLSDLTLQQIYTDSGRMLVSPMASEVETGTSGTNELSVQGQEIYFSGRADIIAVPANRSQTPGLMEYPVNGLGSVHHLSSLFMVENQILLQHDLVPAPADWQALQATLSSLDGVSAVSIDTRGDIHVSVDGIVLKGVMDYVVTPGSGSSGTGVMAFDMVGDLTGNGMDDYKVTYANGDRQYLFVYALN